MAAGEEYDDFESWEEMEDAGVLDKKIEKLKAAMSTSVQKDLRSGISNNVGKPDTVLFIEEDGRTRYVPPEPTVKILKRPSINNSQNAGGDGFIVNGDNLTKPKHPHKTLQQREIEYAEARLRILGEAQSPEEKPSFLERICKIQNKTESVPPEPFEQNSFSSNMFYNNLSVTSPSSANLEAMNTAMPTIMTSQLLQTSQAIAHNYYGGAVDSINSSTTGQYLINSSNNNAPHLVVVNSQCGNTNNHHHYHHHHHHHHHHQLYNHVTYNSSSSSSDMSSSSSTSSLVGSMNVTSGNNIVVPVPKSYNLAARQPKGPDGTKGFNFRTIR